LGNHPALGGEREVHIAVLDDPLDSICQTLLSGAFQIPESHSILLDLLRPNHVVLDLGGHIGTFALIAATLCAEVIVVEGANRNLSLLKKSIEINGINNIKHIHAAVSDRPGTVYFRENGPYGWIEKSNPHGTNKEVVAISVDGLLDMLSIERVDFIKMDIEGSEVLALDGMKKLLSSPNAPILAFESNGFTLNLNNHTPEDLIRRVKALGFELYLPRGAIFHPVDDMFFQSVCVADFVAVKPGRFPRESWRLGPALTADTMIADLISEGTGQNVQLREFVARSVRTAPAAIQNDPRIRTLLGRLTTDPEPSVRENAAWFLGGNEASASA